MSGRKSQLENEIEKARRELNALIETREIISRFILEASQKLDRLITEYMQKNDGR